MNNIVIEVLNLEHGKKVIEYFKSLGIDTRDLNGNCTKNRDDSRRYYGIIEGRFDNFIFGQINKLNVKLIELPTKKENLKKENMTKTITSAQGQKIFNSACKNWGITLAQKWGVSIMLSENIKVEESFYLEMRKACTKEQNLLFDEIFGKDILQIDLTDSSTINQLGMFSVVKNGNSLLEIRDTGIFKNKGFYLNKIFDWEIKKDDYGINCLIPTHKK